MDIERIFEFLSKHWIMSSGLFVVSMLLFQDVLETLTRKYKSTSPVGAVALLNKEGTIVIDVRDTAEFAKGHIESARHIPLVRLEEKVAELEPYKNSPVIITCEQGTRSKEACKKLVKHGFTEVYDLSGGMLSWLDQKLPISKKK